MQESIVRRLGFEFRDDGDMVLMEAGGEKFGHVILSPSKDKIDVCKIYDVKICDDMQGQGYGKILMKEVTGRLENMKRKGELEVWSENLAAINLYKSVGFEFTINSRGMYSKILKGLESHDKLNMVYRPKSLKGN